MLLVSQGLSSSAPSTLLVPEFLDMVVTLAPVLLGLAWLLITFFALWFARELYGFIIAVPIYLGTIKYTILQVVLPEDAEETPKSMEDAISHWGGIHYNPDVKERYFDGFVDWWYSLEVQCTPEKVRYFLFIPTIFRPFFEGVIYGQYPEAEIQEAEDYTLNYDYRRVRQDFEVYGTDMILSLDDVYPIRSYTQYGDPLSPTETFIDPHQSMIEAYSNVNPGEEYWFQVIVWPASPAKKKSWVAKGEKEIAQITGRAKEAGPGFFKQLRKFFTRIPQEVVNVLRGRHASAGEEGEEQLDVHFFDPVETIKMESILRKISRDVYRCMVRLIYIAPKGKLHKPNIGRAIGPFKQFWGANAFRPDPKTKSNGVDYIMKERRRLYRERTILAEYQWRDPLGMGRGPYMLTAEEVATVYHFPTKWIQAPVLERAKAGTYSAPEEVPYV
ncbi:MAG: hypothetical protein AAB538_01165 [Patescibacteria group bacterium]